QALMRVAISGAALLLALTLAGPAASSYFKNKDFLKESEKRAKITSTLDWSDGKPVSTKFPPLKPTLEQLKELDKHQEEGVPIGMGWMMYSADKVRRPLLAVYVSQMQTGFVIPCKAKLEERLKSANGERYLRDRTTLKLYLMLNDVEHLDVEWATGRYTQLWTEVLKQTADISDSEIKDLARPHVAYYFELLKAGKITPLGLDTQLVKQVRDALQSISVQQRYYEMFVNSLNDERIDESGDPTIDNMVFPPIQLPRLFPDRQEVLKYFKSNRYETTKSYQEVEGPYTDKGHAAVVKQIEAAEGLIKAESWVVPPTADETPAKIPEYVKGVAKAYEGKYISEWTDFFADIKVTTPTTADDAIDLYRIMSTTEYPLRRLLQSLEDNTQWKSVNPLEANDAVAREVNRRFNQKLNMYTSGIVLNVDLKSVGKQLQVIPEKFKSACSFAQAGKGDSKVFKYAEIVKRLREQIIEAKNQDPTLDLRKMNDQLQAARDAASQLTAGMDDTGVSIVRPLMLDGLNVGVRPTLGGGVDVNKLQPGQAPPKDGKTPPQTWNFPKNK
ncbi:MAG TPA: ImcF-related family protein, partial [Polyangiaceae bacterium]|nr:ImcF-related family protein [Polyangiaceae bacterium]